MTTVAWVGGTPVDVSDVDALEAGLRLRSGGARPCRGHGTSEGRQLRRWLVQVLVAERLVAAEARGARAVDGDRRRRWPSWRRTGPRCWAWAAWRRTC